MNGPLVKVKWHDAAQQVKTHSINIANPVENLSISESIGELVANDDKAIVLVSHWNDVDGVDILAIPKDWCTKIEVLEVVGEAITDPCIIENLESQQE
tara:strand:- start:3275 stop:3568 length:294 start_codon:yes stop_codon:yes gene_type:complete